MKQKVIPILIVIAGFLLLAYPFLSNYLFEKSAGSTVESYQEKTDMMDQKIKEKVLDEARTEIDRSLKENYYVYYKGVVEILDRFHINTYKKVFKYSVKSKKWFICGNYDDIMKAHRKL